MTGRSETTKRVLIVDDSHTMRAFLDSVLANQARFDVVGLARNADEAMQLVESQRPHIVMTDLCMPGKDGTELLSMLADYRTLCKVVLSTRANLTEPVQRQLTALGATAIFDKQEIARDPKGFLAALRGAADGHGVTPPAAPDPAADTNVVHAAARFPVPHDEPVRARMVQALNIANLDVDPRLNILARHLARLTRFPIASISVIGAEQLWVKAGVGIAPQFMPRGETVCAHAICTDGPTVVCDMRYHPASRALPFVAGAPHLRAYAGVPIVGRSGAKLGVVCVADTSPRRATRAELDVLSDVAALVASALETPVPPLRRAA